MVWMAMGPPDGRLIIMRVYCEVKPDADCYIKEMDKNCNIYH